MGGTCVEYIRGLILGWGASVTCVMLSERPSLPRVKLPVFRFAPSDRTSGSTNPAMFHCTELNHLCLAFGFNNDKEHHHSMGLIDDEAAQISPQFPGSFASGGTAV